MSVLNLEHKRLRVQSACPSKRSKTNFEEESGQLNLSSTAGLAVKIYNYELGEVKARIQQSAPVSLQDKTIRLKDRHIRKAVDFKGKYLVPKFRDDRKASAEPEEARSRPSPRRRKGRRASTGAESFMSSTVKSRHQASLSSHFTTTADPSFSPKRPTTTHSSPQSKRQLRPKTQGRLLILNAIEDACVAMTSIERPDVALMKQFKDMKKIKSRLNWTSQTLDRIDASDAKVMMFQYAYYRSERANETADMTIARQELTRARQNPFRPICTIERVPRRSRGR
jgi:hypothetical protein